MTDFCARLAKLRRPRLLIRAARFGLSHYRRERDLRRLIELPAAPELAFDRLMRAEGKLEENRQNGNAAYSVADHIEVLIALLAESKLGHHSL
jgi:hypothetical protein